MGSGAVADSGAAQIHRRGGRQPMGPSTRSSRSGQAALRLAARLAQHDLDHAVAGLGNFGERARSASPRRERRGHPGVSPVVQGGWVGFAAHGRDIEVSRFQMAAEPPADPRRLAKLLLAPFEKIIEPAGRVRVLSYGSCAASTSRGCRSTASRCRPSPGGLQPRPAGPSAPSCHRADRKGGSPRLQPRDRPGISARRRGRGEGGRSERSSPGAGWALSWLHDQGAAVHSGLRRSRRTSTSSTSPGTEASPASAGGTARCRWRTARA